MLACPETSQVLNCWAPLRDCESAEDIWLTTTLLICTLPTNLFFQTINIKSKIPRPLQPGNMTIWKLTVTVKKIWKFLTSIWFHSVDLLCFICDIQDPLILDFFWVINLLFLFRFPLIYCFNLLQTEFLAPIYQTPLMAFKREFCTSLPLHQIISNYFWRQVNWWRQFIV